MALKYGPGEDLLSGQNRRSTYGAIFIPLRPETVVEAFELLAMGNTQSLLAFILLLQLIRIVTRRQPVLGTQSENYSTLGFLRTY